MQAVSSDIGSADFQEKVVTASHRVPVLVDFWAEWCAPCRTLKPILEKLAAEYGGRFLLAKVDSDRNQDLAARYGIRGIPCVKAFVGGEMVDEFTGALPEPRVREFIDALLPSPAEPLRLEALAARDSGDSGLACTLLADALELDPANEAAWFDLAEIRIQRGEIDEARAMLEVRGSATRDDARLAALRAHLALAENGNGANRAELESRVANAPDDLDARLKLAHALALAREYRPALEQLLSIVKRDRNWQDHAARKSMLELFTLLGSDAQFDDLVREFRVALARTLN